MKKLFFAFAAVLFLLVSSGCTAAKNIENSKRLRVGMTKAQVLEVMGRPIEDEAYCKPDVWFYPRIFSLLSDLSLSQTNPSIRR